MKLIVLLSLFFLLIGCSSNSALSDNIDNKVSIEDSSHIDLWGIYEGIMPCADCPGIEVKLELCNNDTYKLTSNYLEREFTTFEEGNISIQNDLVILSSSSGQKMFYKYTKGVLILCNEFAEVFDNKMIEYYTLKKQE